MQPFDPAKAIPGTMLTGVDASTLLAGRDVLIQSRLDDQHQLLATKTRRATMIVVNCQGVVLSGNHGSRAAAEAGVPIEIAIIDLPYPSQGPILSIPVVRR
jgi:hypothetical protein